MAPKRQGNGLADAQSGEKRYNLRHERGQPIRKKVKPSPGTFANDARPLPTFPEEIYLRFLKYALEPITPRHKLCDASRKGTQPIISIDTINNLSLTCQRFRELVYDTIWSNNTFRFDCRFVGYDKTLHYQYAPNQALPRIPKEQRENIKHLALAIDMPKCLDLQTEKEVRDILTQQLVSKHLGFLNVRTMDITFVWDSEEALWGGMWPELRDCALAFSLALTT
ncbi:hypothetical protein H2201_009004 [Coniosporium apollinis]|uniref:F-box domain-containing protein n=1 Tax=Coniosporium apollinis TaxID=61459 RepID=A0ABQ9NFC2_9PEZI|nr:hypothetical protein H2201_009004 [Coniosporium apollinis]